MKKAPISKNTLTLMKKYKSIYLFFIPGALILIIFAYFPMIGVLMAFQKYDPVSGFFGSEWIGFENFGRLFASPVFGRALRNTLIISSLKLIFCFPMPIIFALLMNELKSNKFKKIVQTTTYLPNFISWVVVAGIWYSLLATDGVVNQIMINIGVIKEPILFMQKQELFYPIIIFTELWKSLGYGTIFYLAAMTSIPLENYEAAMMDGANRFQQAIYITIPGISSTIALMFILQVSGILNAGFDQLWTMSNLAVREIADILDTAVLRTLISGSIDDLSLGAALGMFKSVVGLLLFIVTNIVSKKLNQESFI